MRNARLVPFAVVAAAACLLTAAGCGRGSDHAAVSASRHDAGVRIGPDRPDATTQLEAVVELSGVDPAGCRFEWRRNGERIAGEERAVLPPSAFRKDDAIAVVVTVPPAGGAATSRVLKAEVRIANAPPTVASARIAISATPSGTVLQAEQEASDPDGDALTSEYRWFANGRAVADAHGPTFALASAARGGTYAVEVVVNDGASRSEPRRTSEFVLENRPPAFTSQPASVLPADGIYRYTVTASDPDGDAVRFDLVQAPDGMTITPTGAIEWKVPAGALRPKSAHVVVRVSDAKGGEATQTIELAL